MDAVYSFYRRMCDKLDIPVHRGKSRGPHAFKRNAITSVVEKSGGNTLMASQLFGNSPEVAKSHYYMGLDMDLAREILNK